MLRAIEGSAAVARAVALCRPQVIAAYPITPQTHIVENLAQLIADGKLQCELVSVESEFSAASAVLGAAAAGSRAYTASSAQGILLMTEVLYNIAGLRIPLVLTCANRAIGAPVSAWNDQQDSMAMRDAGWIQLYCADNQEAVDTTIQAYRIAETDRTAGHGLHGWLTSSPIPWRRSICPPRSRLMRSCRAIDSRATLDPLKPISIGNLVTPEYYTEARYTHHHALLRAGEEIVATDREWAEADRPIMRRPAFGRRTRTRARIGILSIGSVMGTLPTRAMNTRNSDQ